MAEASGSHTNSDDVILIPDTPSPVFSKRTATVGFKGRQPTLNISPIKRSSSNSAAFSFSPPGETLSFPGQDSFASERAEAVKKKKLKYKITHRINDNGLSPIKRLSPDKAGFIRSSELLNSGSQNKSSSPYSSKGLKRDVSPNIYSPSNSLYERIKSKQKSKTVGKPITKTSVKYGWPSDSDSSDDEILAGVLDSIPTYKCERKTSNGNKLVIKKTGSQSVSPVKPESSPVKKNSKDPVQLFQESDDELEFAASGIPRSSSQSSFKRVNQLSGKACTESSLKSPEKQDFMLNNRPSSPSLLSDIGHSRKDKHKHHRNRHHHSGSHSAKPSCSSRAEQKNVRHDHQISSGLRNLTGLCASLSSQTGSARSKCRNETGSDHILSRQERKRRHENMAERQSTKIPKSEGRVKTKTPVIDLSESSEATPETRNVISVVSQLEKDEEVARQLQAELDREFAMALQNQNEAGGEDADAVEEYRYHSPFGDIGHHRVNSPRPRRGGQHRDRNAFSPPRWHMFDPVRVSRDQHRDEIPRMELEQLIADAANSIHAGLEYEMMMAGGGGRRRGGRRARGNRAGGILGNLMFTGSDNVGSDYEALMDLGELIGDVKKKGLSKNDVQRLPTVVFKADENNANTECHICMADYENGDSLKILPCFHSYHGQCIDKWIKQNATCPVCRVEIKLS